MNIHIEDWSLRISLDPLFFQDSSSLLYISEGFYRIILTNQSPNVYPIPVMNGDKGVVKESNRPVEEP